MRYVLPFAVGAVLLNSSLAAQGTGACKLTAGERAGIDSARQARADALLHGDPVAATDVAPNDSVILPAGGPAQQGREALLEFFKARTKPGVLKHVEIRQVEVLGCGTYAYDWGHFRWETSGGTSDSTKYLWVWRHEPDRRWRLAVAMWNQDR
jgi:ketosteroid isomerase-like protein